MPTMKDEAPDSRIQWESLEESHNWIDSITLPEIRNIDETWRDLVQAIQRKARKNLGNREEKLNNDKFKNVPTLNEWKSHFEKLFSAKTPTLQLPELAPVENLELKIEEEDVEFSLKQMKTGKEAGVDDIPIDFWKLFPRAIKFLTDFFIAILESRKIPTQWKWAFIMPRYKGIGETNDCAMYRPIQHLSHTRKLFEKIFERKLRALGIGTTENQCGHKKNRGVKVAHRGLRSLLASSSPIHMAFLDIKNANDSVTPKCAWWALRKHSVPENYIDFLKLMLVDQSAQVFSRDQLSDSFPIETGFPQGSPLSNFLLVLVVDAITRDLQRPFPWTILYSDDILLADETREGLEFQCTNWARRLAEFGLKFNEKKGKYLNTEGGTGEALNIENFTIDRAKSVVYLGKIFDDTLPTSKKDRRK